VQRAGLVVPLAVWVLGLVSPPPKGLTLDYIATYTALLATVGRHRRSEGAAQRESSINARASSCA
jgi:hypothetical protein